jgi:hypothetical protein
MINCQLSRSENRICLFFYIIIANIDENWTEPVPPQPVMLIPIPQDGARAVEEEVEIHVPQDGWRIHSPIVLDMCSTRFRVAG